MAYADIGARDYTFADAGFIARDFVNETLVVQKGGFAAKVDIGGTLSAFVHSVGYRVGNGAAIGDANIR